VPDAAGLQQGLGLASPGLRSRRRGRHFTPLPPQLVACRWPTLAWRRTLKPALTDPPSLVERADIMRSSFSTFMTAVVAVAGAVIVALVLAEKTVPEPASERLAREPATHGASQPAGKAPRA
jgi:hypothetical protein